MIYSQFIKRFTFAAVNTAVQETMRFIFRVCSPGSAVNMSADGRRENSATRHTQENLNRGLKGKFILAVTLAGE